MRFRTKILLLFSVTAILTNAISVGMMYELSKRFVFEEYREKVLSIASTVGALLDGDVHEKLRARVDESSPEYKQQSDLLRRARDANRRENSYIKYLFTIFRAPSDPGVFVIGVDPEEGLEDSARLGDVYNVRNTRRIPMDRPAVDEDFSVDRRGEWLAADAPLKNSAGRVVGAVRAEFSADRVGQKLRPVLLSGLAALFLATALSVASAYLLSSNVSRPTQDLKQTIEDIGHGNFDARMAEDGYGVEFTAVARTVNRMAAELKDRDLVKSAFSRYVSRQIMESVVSSGAPPVLTGDRRRITVLFSDIMGFSTLAESMAPEAVVALLNEYFERMVDIIFRNGGTLDKFLGDGIMVTFGSPNEDPLQEEHAINCAIEMQRELRTLDRKWEAEGRPQLRIGVGVNSGLAIVGNIGSSRRMEYTAMGDTVNLAARLESATRSLGVDIVVAEDTYNAVASVFPARDLGTITVKGRRDLTRVYGISVEG
ncbi:MAG: HAMP domain-containing protein [Acidobacteria bacterium]|nr:HAMP domain-containing protein [Acidobacteriota bacterium]